MRRPNVMLELKTPSAIFGINMLHRESMIEGWETITPELKNNCTVIDNETQKSFPIYHVCPWKDSDGQVCIYTKYFLYQDKVRYDMHWAHVHVCLWPSFIPHIINLDEQVIIPSAKCDDNNKCCKDFIMFVQKEKLNFP